MSEYILQDSALWKPHWFRLSCAARCSSFARRVTDRKGGARQKARKEQKTLWIPSLIDRLVSLRKCCLRIFWNMLRFFFMVYCQCCWGYWDCRYFTPPFHPLPLHISPCPRIQRQQICAPSHSGGPGTRNHGFSSLWSIWAAIQAWQLCFRWVDNKSGSDHSSWTDSTCVSHPCMCAACVWPTVTDNEAALRFHCTAQYYIFWAHISCSPSVMHCPCVDWDSSCGDLAKIQSMWRFCSRTESK